MSTASERSTKTLDRAQRAWLQTMGAALGVSVKSEDGLGESVGVKAADDLPIRPQFEGADDLLLDFVARIVIVNKTDVVLRKLSDKVERGRYQIQPEPTVPARQAKAFTVVDKQRVKGTITYVPVGGPGGESWQINYNFAPVHLPGGSSNSILLNDSGRFTQEQKQTDTELHFILGQKGPPPSAQSFVSRVFIMNDSDLELQKSFERLSAGVFETAPPSKIPPRQPIEFEVRSQGTASQVQQQFVVGELTWRPGGNDSESWSVKYNAATGLKSTADSDIRSERLIADKPQISGTNFRFNLRDQGTPPPPRPESFLSHVVVDNRTDVVLTKVGEELSAGVFEPQPRETVPPGEPMEFAVRSEQKSVGGAPREAVSGSLTWRPEGAADGEEWLIQYGESPRGENKVETSTINSEQFIGEVVSSRVFEFRLKRNPQPPPIEGFVSRVVVVNNTDVALRQKDTLGKFVTKPPATIPAQTPATAFTVKSEKSVDGNDFVSGFVEWEPEGFPRGERWLTSFSRSSTDNDGIADQDLKSIRFAADQPVSKGNDFQFTLNQAAEPEFKKPEPTRQPTLRLNDKGVDGWVEYLQEQLNALLTPSPNLKVDGHFGGATHKAVFAFQAQAEIQKDGTVGNQTWAALRHGPAEEPSTDQRPPHTVKEEGLEARWLTEDPAATFSQSKDELVLVCVSVGDQTSLEGQKVNLFVTPPGGKRKGFVAKIGERIEKSKTGQGDHFKITLADFRKTFPSIPETAPVQGYVIEAFFDKELSSDFYTSTKGGFNVVE